jgi:hypothetical protein
MRWAGRRAGSFGIGAAALIALAALVGLSFLATRVLKGRHAGILIGMHGTLAEGGYLANDRQR